MKLPEVKTVAMWVSIVLNIFQFASNQAKEWYVLVNSTKNTTVASENPYNVKNSPHFERTNKDTIVTRASITR